MSYPNRAGAGSSRAGRPKSTAQAAARTFRLYVEGPLDCAILRSWARQISRPLERSIESAAVILGGRQPARAVEHFRREVELGRANRGLCVLDRDDGQEGAEAFAAVPGLEFFTWPRRHIESYLLVPDAICRSLNGGADSGRAARLLAEHLPAEGTDPERIATDAKRLLDPQGALSQELGLPLSAVGIARAMRPVEIHPEVWELLERARECAGLAPTTRRVGLRE